MYVNKKWNKIVYVFKKDFSLKNDLMFLSLCEWGRFKSQIIHFFKVLRYSHYRVHLFKADSAVIMT